MGAPEIFRSLFKQGVFLNAENGRLIYQSKTEPDRQTIETIKAHKFELLRFLSVGESDDEKMNMPHWLTLLLASGECYEAAKECFEERAGILEYDAGLPRPEAERQAALETLEWMKAKATSHAPPLA